MRRGLLAALACALISAFFAALVAPHADGARTLSFCQRHPSRCQTTPSPTPTPTPAATSDTPTPSPTTSAPVPPPTSPTTAAPTPLVSDDFNDLSGWYHPYNGAGAYSQQGARLASNVEVASNTLTVWARPVTTSTTIGTHTLQPGDYAAGGIMNLASINPGERITLDLRMDASAGTRAVALLWPQGSWPADGELDFTEDGAEYPDRQATAITNHWANATGGNAQQVVRFGPHDFTAWSHVEVTWQPTSFVVTIDGVVAAQFTDHMPPGPMNLAVQTAVAGGGQSPTYNGAARTPGNIQVRSLRIYAD